MRWREELHAQLDDELRAEGAAAERARLRKRVATIQNRSAEGAEMWSPKFKAGYGVGWERAIQHVLVLFAEPSEEQT